MSLSEAKTATSAAHPREAGAIASQLPAGVGRRPDETFISYFVLGHQLLSWAAASESRADAGCRGCKEAASD